MSQGFVSLVSKVGGVGAGVWRFRVRGADEAGNTGNEVLTEWRYDPDTSKVCADLLDSRAAPHRHILQHPVSLKRATMRVLTKPP